MKHFQSAERPLVSFILPCYNDGIYLEEAIASCRMQTYKNIEIIVVDDGSDQPETLDYLRKIKAAGDIKVVQGAHSGPSAARNLGIKNASGTFIFPLDSDDVIGPTLIEKAVSVLEAHPEVGFVYCLAEKFGAAQGKWDLPAFHISSFVWDNLIFNAALYRKESWEKVGGYDEKLIHGNEDHDLWLSFVKNGWVPYRIPETLFYYRIKPVSRTSRFSNANLDVKVDTYHRIFTNHQDFLSMYMREIYGHRYRLEKFILKYNRSRILYKLSGWLDIIKYVLFFRKWRA